jgi:Family of unknown function (DUF5996)
MTPTAAALRPDLPALPLDAWEPTKTTLHLWAQIVGKVKLAATAPRNHWWNVPLYLDVRGLTTRRLHHGQVSFQIDFDFVDHRLVVATNRVQEGSFPLRDGLSVAAFDRQLHQLLDQLDVDVAIREDPYGVPMTTPFPADTEHAAYDPDYARCFWQVLNWADTVLEEFSGWYCGKQSPIHLFWHSLDLAVTRFSGRLAPTRDGADPVTREAYSHELISFGFWAGDQTTREPAFYAYAAPEPPGLADQPLQPAAAAWRQVYGGSMALLGYDQVRAAHDPRSTLLGFLESAYDAGVRTAGWDRQELTSSFCPSPAELQALYQRATAPSRTLRPSTDATGEPPPARA